jgi:RNA polymerase sigma factor (sigma-70 family)
MTGVRSPLTVETVLAQTDWLRRLARSLVVQEDRAEDLLQETLLVAVEQAGVPVGSVRSWLGVVTQNLARRLSARERDRCEVEAVRARADLAEATGEVVGQAEMHRRVTEAVLALEEPYRSTILFRFMRGLSYAELAERMKVPIETVRTRVKRGLKRLRLELDDSSGSCRAWAAPILGVSSFARLAPTSIGNGSLCMGSIVGGVVMNKVLVPLGVAVVLVCLWAFWPSATGEPGGTSGDESPVRPLVAELPATAKPEPIRRTELAEKPPKKATPTAGSLIVKATYEVDGKPVPDLVVMVGPPGADHRVGYRRDTTDAAGFVRFEDLPAGRIWVQNVRHDDLVRTAIEAGVETEAALVLPKGRTATGIVVDRHGVGVPGAAVILKSQRDSSREFEHVTDTDADGRFHLPSCPKNGMIGARAEGHAPSIMQFLFAKSKEIRIELPATGGGVTGAVSTDDGSPVRDAVVRIGRGSKSGISGAPTPPALVRTDIAGRFHALGLAVGTHPIEVRAAGLAPWQGNCQVQAGATLTRDITLQRGVICTGVVVDGAGTPLVKVEVEVGSWDDIAHYRAFTGEDGTFRLEGLPAGNVELRAEHHKHGVAKMKVRGAFGETVTCTLVMDLGLELRGRILTADGKPLHRAFVDARVNRDAKNAQWGQVAVTNAKGEFAITNCPEGRSLTVGISGRGVLAKRVDDVDPRDGELEVRLDPAPLPTARLAGRIVRPDGKPATRAQISATERKGAWSGIVGPSEQGAFRLGPLVPGEWRLTIRAEGLPQLTTEWRTLAADEKVELGTIWLVAGGTVRVEVHAPDGLAPRMSLRAGARYYGLRGGGRVLRSDPVPPGACQISVHGEGVGSQIVPVHVRAGEETKARVTVEAGYEQRFRFTDPKTPSVRRVQIAKGEQMVVDLTHRARLTRALPAKWQRWLAPGEYVVTVDGDGLRGQVRFTVRAGENDVVNVEMK